MGIESVLKAGINALPEKAKLKGQQVPNALKKMGVKDEELKFADIEIKPEESYTKADLQKLESGRKDTFDKVQVKDPSYKWVSLEKGLSNPTYKENVYTFAEGTGPRVTPQEVEADRLELERIRIEDEDAYGDEIARLSVKYNISLQDDTDAFFEFLANPTNKEKSRYTSAHFPDVPNYLLHTRTFDDTMDGKPTRVLQEIQSDLHQQGRAQGYGTSTAFSDEEIATLTRYLDDDSDEALDEALDVLEKYNLYTGDEDVEDTVLSALNRDASGGVPKSPYEKSWLAKGIERELDSAIEDGRQQLAIPIKGTEIDKLKRAEGVQKWYESQVANTAKKIAKQNGMDFELKTTGTQKAGIPDTTLVQLLDEIEFGMSTNEAAEVFSSYTGYKPSTETEWNFIDFMINQAEDLPHIHEVFSSFVKPSGGTQYAIIKPKGIVEDIPAKYSKMTIDKDVIAYRKLEQQLDELDLPPHLIMDPQATANTVRLVEEEQLNLRKELITKYGQTQALDDALGGSFKGRKKLVEQNAATSKFKADRPNLKLYSSPAAAVAAGYATLRNGGTDDDVRFELVQAGYDADEVDQMLGDAKFAMESVDVHGDSEEDVMAFFKGQEPEIAERTSAPIDQPVEKSYWEQLDVGMQAALGNPKKDAYGAILSDEGMTAEQLLSRLQVISPNMSSITTRISGYFGNETAAREQEEAVKASAQHIVNLAKQHGIQMAFQPNPEGDGIDQLAPFGGGSWFVQGPDGQAQPVDEGFWEAMRQESHEITYGVTGAFAGGGMTAKVTKNPLLIGLGSVVGAVTGAGVGTEIDYLRDSIALHEEMSAEVAAHKALTAAEASAIGDLVGYPLAKGAGAIWKGTIAAKDLLWQKNPKGAHKALKAIAFKSDSEITDMTIALEKAIVPAEAGTKTKTVVDYEGQVQSKTVEQQPEAISDISKGLRSTVLTEPGLESIVRVVGSVDPIAGAAVAKAIDNRSRDVLDSASSLTTENVGRVLVHDLSNYTNDVKRFYGNVKEQVAKSPRINDFAWDFEKLAIKPVLDTLQKNIMDPTVLERFKLQANRVNAMSDSRTLTDLLELRQLVNDFKFNKRITKVKDFDTLNNVIGNIDSAIKQGANAVMEEPQKWLNNYATAKTQYAKMKGLERNVLAKALRTPGLDQQAVVDSLVKYIAPIDSTFQDLMAALPMQSRVLTEGAVLNSLAEKFTAGISGSQRATHFPLFADELSKVVFTTPEARKYKAAITELATVFKNDIPLSQSTGNIQLQKFQSFLTTDPKARIQFELATGVFNYIKTLAPTKTQRNTALVMNLAKLLENPLNSRSIKEVMTEVGGDTNLVKQITELQQEVAKAKAAGDVGSTKVNLYGDGQVLSMKGSGKVTQVPIHRIATYENQQTIANKYGIDRADKKLLDQAIKSEGYMAIQQGSNQVRKIK